MSTTTPDESYRAAKPFTKRVYLALAAVLLGVVVAGFWNYHAVDGFGRMTFAEPLVGETGEAATSYGSLGPSFGILFAVAAGLAATFTACNCVVFAMLPGLALDSDEGVNRGALLRNLIPFVGSIVLVGIAYGTFIGMLGPEGIEAMNSNAVRLAQAQAVFSLLGVGLLVWGSIELGFLASVTDRLPSEARTFFAQSYTRAGVMGLFVGMFAVGRPFPVFRDLLTYAANANSPLYGAAVMVINDLGMIAIMLLLLFLMVRVLGTRLASWVQRNPHGPRTLSGSALLAGGAYFVFYWGLAFAYDIGNWGFKIGIYG